MKEITDQDREKIREMGRVIHARGVTKVRFTFRDDSTEVDWDPKEGVKLGPRDEHGIRMLVNQICVVRDILWHAGFRAIAHNRFPDCVEVIVSWDPTDTTMFVTGLVAVEKETIKL